MAVKTTRKKKGDKAEKPESRWSQYQDAPEVLQDIAQEVRDEHHASLKQATIRIVMVPKAPKSAGEEVLMRMKVHDALTVAKEGIHGTVIVSGPWYDRNDPRQMNLGDERRDLNRRMVARALDEMFCSVAWDTEAGRLKKQPPLAVYKAVMLRWGPLPGSMEEEVAQVLVAREAAGTKFLASLNGQDGDPDE